ALGCLLPLLAQVDTGVVSGIITDRSGAVVPGAKITVTWLETKIETETQTNKTGFYSASALRPGRYEISVAKEGFRSQTSLPLDVHVQDRAERNFQLDLQVATDEIEVGAAAP